MSRVLLPLSLALAAASCAEPRLAAEDRFARLAEGMQSGRPGL